MVCLNNSYWSLGSQQHADGPQKRAFGSGICYNFTAANMLIFQPERGRVCVRALGHQLKCVCLLTRTSLVSRVFSRRPVKHLIWDKWLLSLAHNRKGVDAAVGLSANRLVCMRTCRKDDARTCYFCCVWLMYCWWKERNSFQKHFIIRNNTKVIETAVTA